jgi:putative PIN family toxin of toxin-antitoxin system
MRIVLDTNVLISAFLSRMGAPFQIMQLTRTSDMVLVMSRAVFQELERVIHYPYLRAHADYSDNQVERFLRGIEQASFWIPVNQTLAVVEADESDNRFIELAVSGKAQYIITGDKRHLLPLRRYQGIEIVSPTEFLALYRSDSA